MYKQPHNDKHVDQNCLLGGVSKASIPNGQMICVFSYSIDIATIDMIFTCYTSLSVDVIFIKTSLRWAV